MHHRTVNHAPVCTQAIRKHLGNFWVQVRSTTSLGQSMALHSHLRHASKNQPPSRSNRPRLLARSERYNNVGRCSMARECHIYWGTVWGDRVVGPGCKHMRSAELRGRSRFRSFSATYDSKRVLQKGSSCTMHALLFYRLTQNIQISSLLPPPQRRRHPLAYYASQVASGKPHTTTRPCIFITLTVHDLDAGRGHWRLIEGRGGLMVPPHPSRMPLSTSEAPRLVSSYRQHDWTWDWDILLVQAFLKGSLQTTEYC